MMLWRIVFGLIAAITVLPTAALADPKDSECDLVLVAMPAQWTVADIDVFANDPVQRSFDLQLVNSGGGACRVRIALDTQGAPLGLAANDGRRVLYSVIDHATGSDLTPRTGRSPIGSRAAVTISPHSEVLARYDVVVPSQFDTDGSYQQPLIIEAADQKTGEIVALRAVSLVAQVASSATLALSGDFTRVGGIADVDLGDLQSDTSKVPLTLHVRSTRAYTVRSSSENAGKLVLAGTGWSIPYKLTFDGTEVDPAGGTYLSSAASHSRADNLKLGFVIGGNTNVEAGRYSDVVTLEVALR